MALRYRWAMRSLKSDQLCRELFHVCDSIKKKKKWPANLEDAIVMSRGLANNALSIVSLFFF